jgi:hypothetical protein
VPGAGYHKVIASDSQACVELEDDRYRGHNGRAMDLEGRFSGSNQPVLRGDFQSFSRIPDGHSDLPAWANPYGRCGPATGGSGNPWDLSPPQNPGINPPAHFCLDYNLPIDPDYSS